MGKISKGILGGFSGRVGTVVGSRIFTIDVMRSYQPDVRNPRSAGQMAQRNKFAFLVAFLRRILPILRTGWGKAASKMSAWNAALAYNILNAVTGTSPNFQIGYANLKISEGALTGFSGPLFTVPVGGGVSLEWMDNSNQGDALDTDLFYGVVYNVTKDNFVIQTGANTRQDGACAFDYDNWEAGDVCHGWGYFISADGAKVSDSVYFGTDSLLD